MTEQAAHINKVLLVGNPNVGKSVIFAWLTGRYVTVSNYPGTTVEIAQGMMHTIKGETVVIDTPGINSLIPQSEDERITRDMILKEKGMVVQVADAKNLERALHISLGLIEMGVPFMLVLNMQDEADERGINIDAKKLEDLLGVPVVQTVATTRLGLDKIKARLKEAAEGRFLPIPRYLRSELEEAAFEIEKAVGSRTKFNRSLTHMVLAQDPGIVSHLKDTIPQDALARLDEICRRAAASFAKPLASLISEDRGRYIDSMLSDILVVKKIGYHRLKEKMAASMVHPGWGLLWAAAFLAAIYIVVGKLVAGNLVDWLNNAVFQNFIVLPASSLAYKYLFSWPGLIDFLLGPYGIISMGLSYALAIVMPIVAAFFFIFGILEDIGYLPRLAVMLNRSFQRLGLQGKAVLPMILGFGCGAMATIVTRVLETRKERVIATLLLALGIPCSAQLGVILGLFGSLPAWAPVVWGLSILITMLAVGKLAGYFVSGRRSDFIMEVPPLRLPVAANLIKKTANRTWWYLREAVPLFVLGAAILSTMERFNLLSAIERLATPLVTGILGLPAQAAAAFIMGFIRRDYGAVYFFDMFNKGLLDNVQAVVAIVVITLFVPCFVSALVIIKERGWKMALAIFAVVIPIAFAVGGLLRVVLRFTEKVF